MVKHLAFFRFFFSRLENDRSYTGGSRESVSRRATFLRSGNFLFSTWEGALRAAIIIAAALLFVSSPFLFFCAAF